MSGPSTPLSTRKTKATKHSTTKDNSPCTVATKKPKLNEIDELRNKMAEKANRLRELSQLEREMAEDQKKLQILESQNIRSFADENVNLESEMGSQPIPEFYQYYEDVQSPRQVFEQQSGEQFVEEQEEELVVEEQSYDFDDDRQEVILRPRPDRFQSSVSIQNDLKHCVSEGCMDMFNVSLKIAELKAQNLDTAGILESFTSSCGEDVQKVVYNSSGYTVEDRLAILENALVVSTNLLLAKKVKYIPLKASGTTGRLDPFRWCSTKPDIDQYPLPEPFSINKEELSSWSGCYDALPPNIIKFLETFLKTTCTPKDEIKKYTCTTRAPSAQHGYVNLPRMVVLYLEDCVHEIFGFGREELKMDKEKVESTEFFTMLGESEEERMKNFMAYKEQSKRVQGSNFKLLVNEAIQNVRRCHLVNGKMVRTNTPKAAETNYDNFMKLAHEFGVPGLHRICEKFLMANKKLQIVEKLKYAETHNYNELMKKCIKSLETSNQVKMLKKSVEFDNFKESTKLAIMRRLLDFV